MEQEIIKNLENKNIILFGVSEEAIEFYNKYHAKLHISFCVTSYSENVILQPMRECGLETFLYDDVKITEEDYLIICDSEYFQPLERRLQTDGMVEYKQYLSSKLAAGILEQKKIVVLMGSEFISQLVTALETLQEIKKHYYCIYYSESELLKAYANRMAEYQHVARFSDIYILSVCDKGMYKAKVLTPEFFAKECLRISVSDYTFNGYYPQICTGRDEYSQFLFRERKRLEIPYFTLVLAKEDANLREYVCDNVPVEEIIERISNPEFYSKEQVLQHFENAVENIRKSDEKADIKLAEFIEQFCRQRVGYRNLDEWNTNVLEYVLKQVLEKMGLGHLAVDEEVMADLLETKSGSELPVYPCVLRHLGIEGYQNKKYRVVSYYQTRYMDFEEYIRYCVDGMYKIKELQQFLGIEGV